jgi:hypothetical protein
MKPAPGKAPGFNDLLQDPTVQDAIGKAWLKCQVNPAKMVHEEGGIIYYNPITGDVVVVPFTGEFAPAVAPEGTLATTVMSGLAYPGYYIVGQFHTHPWNPFPSDLDVKNLAITGVPSIIIWPNGKNCTTYGPPQRIGGLAPRLPTPAGSWP